MRITTYPAYAAAPDVPSANINHALSSVVGDKSVSPPVPSPSVSTTKFLE